LPQEVPCCWRYPQGGGLGRGGGDESELELELELKMFRRNLWKLMVPRVLLAGRLVLGIRKQALVLGIRKQALSLLPHQMTRTMARWK